MELKLSASALTLFQECPRCFWLEKIKKIKRPRGIFPSLPSGMDRVIKTYFDTYRLKQMLPPELGGAEFRGTALYADNVQLDKWRNWRTGLQFIDEDGSSLIGALDELMVKEALYIPFDYKTKGSVTTPEDAIRYYQKQLDCYALLLEENQMPTAGYGYLLYFSPKSVGEEGKVLFNLQTIKMDTDPERAKQLFRKAVRSLKNEMPESSRTCEFCLWLGQRRPFLPQENIPFQLESY